MQSEVARQKELEKLKGLLEGAEIVSVQPPVKDEHIFTLIVKHPKRSKMREIQIGATDLGWWVGKVRMLPTE